MGMRPSIKEYAESVTNRAGSVRSTHNMSQDEQDRIMKQYRTIKADHDRIETYKKNKLFEGIKNEIFAMFGNGTSYSEAMAWATNQAGSDPDKYVTYRNAVNAIYGPQGRSGSGGSSNGKLDDDAIGVLEDMLQEGKFSSIDQFLAYAANKGASSAQRGKLEKYTKIGIAVQANLLLIWKALCNKSQVKMLMHCTRRKSETMGGNGYALIA